jgi:aarF domain-containing kinase
MLKAHLESMALVASMSLSCRYDDDAERIRPGPFSHEGPYAFANQTITDSVRALIPIMLRHRLTPPPSETYSLNRKLSGAFLMCARLKANVDCQELWQRYVGDYRPASS